MASSLSRRAWIRQSAMAAAILPVSRWYNVGNEALAPHPTADEIRLIRLGSNENPYGPSAVVRQAIAESLNEANRYPWGMIGRLREEIAKKEDLPPECVIVTAGSTELLGLAGLTFGLAGGEMAACAPTFDFLMIYAERLGCTWARTPLDQHYQYDLDALDRIIGTETRLIFVCNPNNPTGIEIPHARLTSFCETHGSRIPLYVDEAYIELSLGGRSSSMASLIEQHPKIIIGRTFSKIHGLAGMRIGYGLAHPDVIKKMEQFHMGRNMTLSIPACAAAVAALGDAAFEEFSKQKTTEGREMICDHFNQWGVRYLPSAANFVCFSNEQFSARPAEALRHENIIIRDYAYFPGWSRVSVGTTEENKIFLDSLSQYRA